MVEAAVLTQKKYAPATLADMAILASGALLLLLIGVILWDQQDPRGEPFELLTGISIWPSTIVRFGVAVASVAFIWKGVRDLTSSREQLCNAELSTHRQWLTRITLLPRFGQARRSGVCATMRDIFVWTWQRKSKTRKKARPRTRRSISATVLCRWYFHKGRSSYRFVRVSTATLLYLGLAFCVFKFTDGFPNEPYRGKLAMATGRLVLAFAVVFMVALVFFVMDAIQLCRRFIRSLSEETIGWPQEGVARADSARRKRNPKVLRELLIIRVVAKRTNVVGKLLLFPFTSLLLIIVSRHPAFDYWTVPVPLMAVLGLLVGGLVLSALMMRRDANKIRQKVLLRLREHLSVAISAGQPERREQLVQLIDEIGRERHGAFRPLTDDYVFRALAIPFGGAGSLLLLEHLLL